MRWLRTMLAVDTLRLFVLRYENGEVLRAATDAIRKIYDQYARDHGIAPLMHSHGVLTSTNITRAVLLVRETLKNQELVRQQRDNNTADHTSPGRLHRSPSKASRSVSPSSWRSPSSSSFSSSKAFSPRPSPCSSSSSSMTSPRRSILASDGTHVLMNEKLAKYQHRGDADRLPSFKVRRESGASIEEAAKRRQRSIHYGNETSRALRG